MVLSNLGKKIERITSTVAQWIKQHQDTEYVGNGINVLWDLMTDKQSYYYKLQNKE
jgi:hypothetical protein